MKKGNVLVLGGARSGKSTFAEKIAEASGNAKTYVATAEASDNEMRDRIRAHQARRDATWANVEAPVDLADCLKSQCGNSRTVLVDCLTVWLSNQFMQGADIDQESRRLTDSVCGLDGLTIFVSNEVGGGIVPENELARRFRDAQGRLNQQMADVCDTVLLIVAGLPVVLKGKSPL